MLDAPRGRWIARLIHLHPLRLTQGAYSQSRARDGLDVSAGESAPHLEVIRGGTGGANYHSVREWVSLQAMEKATQVIHEIAKQWVERAG